MSGGYELLAQDALQALTERGHQVSVLTGAWRGHESGGGNLPVLGWLSPGLDGEDPWEASLAAGDTTLFRRHFFDRHNLLATRRAIGEVKPDVALLLNMSLLSQAPLMALRWAGVGVLSYVADPWPANHWVLQWRDRLGARQKTPGGLLLLERLARLSRELVNPGRLLVCSEHLLNRLALEGFGDLDVLPLALAPSMVEQDDGLITPRPAGDSLRLICASSLWRGKGQHVLLEALALLPRERYDIQLLLAGGGVQDYLRELEQRCKRPDLAGRVTFAGALTREQLKAELSRSHALVLPSIWQEPFGLATIEGLAAGLAVVASDSGASPELIEHGRTGWLTRAGDARDLAGALAQVFDDEHGRQSMAARARQHALERFDHGRFTDRLEGELLSCARLTLPPAS